MQFELDLAIAYVCFVTLIFWVSTFVVPALFKAAVQAIANWIRAHRAQAADGPEHRDWWGPTHQH